MALLKKIKTSLKNDSIRIIFLGEAYPENTQRQFLQDSRSFLNYIGKVHPFNIAAIEIYSYYEKSDVSIIPNHPEKKTWLESWINGDQWEFDEKKVSKKLETLEFYQSGKRDNLSHFLNKGSGYNASKRTLVCILCPMHAFTQSKKMVYEASNNDDSYYFIATSLHKYWQQVVLRSIGKMLGLGDEYSLDNDFEIKENTFSMTDIIYANQFYPNLFFGSRITVGAKKKELKWHNLIDSDTQHENIEEKNSTTSPTKNLYSDIEIGFYEGGGGYDKNVFRASIDCLMRVNLRKDYFRLFQSPIPFCPVCADFILTELKQLLEENEKSTFSFRQSLILQNNL